MTRDRQRQLPLASAYQMRKALTHGYFKVDFEIVWNAIERDLPSLGRHIRAPWATEQACLGKESASLGPEARKLRVFRPRPNDSQSQSSIPRCAGTPALKACLTRRISVTVSAMAMISCGQLRPVSTTCTS